MDEGMTSNYYVVSFTTFRAHFGEHLRYYVLHRPNELVEFFGIN